jgi:pimeloyl-ACP methyl ester carboxylesterase
MTLLTRRNAELISTAAADGRVLDGLLYEPTGAPPVASLLYLHGKGGNCYSGPGRFVPAGAGAPLRHLALNMRCHDLAYTRPDLPYVDFRREGPGLADGGFWERLASGTVDVAAGVAALRSLGPEPVVLVGHSSGGFYAAVAAAQDASIAGRVLLSPLTSNKRPLPMWFDGEDGLRAALESARTLVRAGFGHRLISLPSWYYAISAASLLERAEEPDDTWLKAVRANTSPLFVLWGGVESRASHWRDVVGGLEGDVRSHEVAGADHNYMGFEDVVARAVTEFALSL